MRYESADYDTQLEILKKAFLHCTKKDHRPFGTILAVSVSDAQSIFFQIVSSLQQSKIFGARLAPLRELKRTN